MQKRNNNFKFNKKGQDLSIGTLILIVLGVIVLVLLVLGFSMGWSNLWEKINIFGGKTSINDVANACSLAVSTNAVYTYCSDFKKVTTNGKIEWLNCQDERIQPSLDTKITCEEPDGKKAGDAFCVKAKADKIITKSTTTNGQPCNVS